MIVPDRTNSYCYTALSEILNRTVGKILPSSIMCHHYFHFDVGLQDSAGVDGGGGGRQCKNVHLGILC